MVGRCSEGEQRALQIGLLRRVYEEVASLNGQSAACVFFDKEKFYDSACLYKLIDLAMARDFPRRLLFVAMQAYLSDRILRTRDMVRQSIQPSSGILAGCSLGNRFARVILYKILDSVNNVLPAQLPAPVETRQFVDDLTTLSVANNEDDVTRSICSVALELRHELEAAKLTLNRSMILNNRQSLTKRVAANPPSQRPSHSGGRYNAGGARRRRSTRKPETTSGKAARWQGECSGPKEPQSSQALHHGHWAVHRPWSGAVRPVAYRSEAVPSHSSGMFGSWRISTLPSHRNPNWNGASTKIQQYKRAFAFSPGGSVSGMKQRYAPTCGRRRGGASTPDFEAQKTDGVSCEDPCRVQLRL